MNFIEDLYFGNINPNEKRYEKDSKYALLAEIFCENEVLLASQLSEESLKLFNDIMNTKDKINAIENMDSFKMGFVLGVQMMTECGRFYENNMFKHALNEKDE